MRMVKKMNVKKIGANASFGAASLQFKPANDKLHHFIIVPQ